MSLYYKHETRIKTNQKSIKLTEIPNTNNMILIILELSHTTLLRSPPYENNLHKDQIFVSEDAQGNQYRLLPSL